MAWYGYYEKPCERDWHWASCVNRYNDMELYRFYNDPEEYDGADIQLKSIKLLLGTGKGSWGESLSRSSGSGEALDPICISFNGIMADKGAKVTSQVPYKSWNNTSNAGYYKFTWKDPVVVKSNKYAKLVWHPSKLPDSDKNWWPLYIFTCGDYIKSSENEVEIEPVPPAVTDISYYVNGGTGTTQSEMVAVGISYKIKSYFSGWTPPHRQAVYNANGGTSTSKANTQLDCPFVNWNTGAKGGGTTYKAGASYTVKVAGLSLYAQYSDPVLKYSTLKTITASGNGDRPFSGWSKSTSSISIITSDLTLTSATTNLYAVWGFIIKYKGNGGSCTVADQTFKYNGSKKIAAWSGTPPHVTVTFKPGTGASVNPTSKDYNKVFTNWNTNTSGTGTTYKPSAEYAKNKDLTLYAVWGPATLSDMPAATKEGKTFSHWEDANGNVYKNGDKISSNLTLYAVFSNTITYYGNGGSCTLAPQTKNPGKSVAIRDWKSTDAAATYRVKYDAGSGSVSPSYQDVPRPFKNWNTNKSGTGTTYKAGATYSTDKDLNLYAQWGPGVLGNLPDPSAPGRNFDHWEYDDGTPAKPGDPVNGNETIHAIYKVIITYDATEGSNPPAPATTDSSGNITLDKGTDMTPPKYSITWDVNDGDSGKATATATKTNYNRKLKEWNTRKDGTGTGYTPGKKYQFSKDTTLYAIWGNATASNPATASWPSDNEQPGAKFLGWSNSKSSSILIDFPISLSKNITVYAIWDYYIVFVGSDYTYKSIKYIGIFGYNSDDSVITKKRYIKHYREDFTVPDLAVLVQMKQSGSGEDSPGVGSADSCPIEFIGWNYNNHASNVTIKKGTIVKRDFPVYIYAVFKVKTYIVRFWDGHTKKPATEPPVGAGGLLKKATVNFGDSVDPPPDPTWKGHEFLGWSSNATNIKANKDINALWGFTPIWIMTHNRGWVKYEPKEN